MWQHEITQPIPLLNEKGELTQAGWARKPYPIYDRSAVKASALRLKEWDYYLVANDRSQSSISDETYYLAVADVNEDGTVDVYDLQRLYEGVNGMRPFA